MTDFSPDSESSPDPTLSNQRWDRWRGRIKLLGCLVLWLLTRGFATIPDDDYGAKDLDGGGFQTLFVTAMVGKALGIELNLVCAQGYLPVKFTFNHTT